jgi:CelD/BcsL family acetyltransferase involved in cellulose biosynthesis
VSADTPVPERYRGLGGGLDGWAELASEWDELADRTSAPPFLRPAWFELFQRAFGDAGTTLLTVRRRGRLVGVAPVAEHGSAVAALANDHTPLFELLAEDDEAAAALADGMLAARPARVTVDYVDADGASVRTLVEAARARGYLVAVREWERPPYVDVHGSWESYEQGLDAKLRRDLARRRRRLEEAGVVEIEVSDGTGDLAGLLDEGFALEPSGWKDARGTAIRSHPSTLAFYTGLARWAADRGSLRLSFLRLDGRPLAFQLALEDGGRYYFVKGGYDPDATRFAPAKLLIQAVLARAFATGLQRFEFLGPPEPFKLEWASGCHDLKRLQLYARTPTGLTGWAATVYGRPLARRARVAARDAQQLRAKIRASSRPPHS